METLDFYYSVTLSTLFLYEKFNRQKSVFFAWDVRLRGSHEELWPRKKFAACILQRRYISVISVKNYELHQRLRSVGVYAVT